MGFVFFSSPIVTYSDFCFFLPSLNVMYPVLFFHPSYHDFPTCLLLIKWMGCMYVRRLLSSHRQPVFQTNHHHFFILWPKFSSTSNISFLDSPPMGFHKFNFDGSRKNNYLSAEIIIRDSNGEPTITKTFNLDDSSIYLA